jgi:hypothetical protein
LKRGWRVLALLVALVGCSGRAEPAVDMMDADSDHRPDGAHAARIAAPTPIPEEPQVPPEE